MPRRNVYILLVVTVVCAAGWIQSDRYGRLLTYAMRQIHERHLEKIDRQDLFEGAVQGMAQRLHEKYADDYSDYVPPDKADRFNQELDQKFGGLGIRIMMPEETGRLTVASPLVGSPAHAAGILAGDVILAIDGHNTEGMTMQDAMELMHGEVGKPVTLKIVHQGDPKPVDMTIVRAVIKVPTVLGDRRNADGSWDFLLEGGDRIGYVRVDAIAEGTDEELRKALAWLARHDARGLILDLRFNPGGYLRQAIAICDMFVDSGVIVSTRGRDGRNYQEHRATGQGTCPAFPMAVLINHDSASAAEIIAACLQDHHRAAVIGQRSFGKGVVQELLPLDAEEGQRCGLLKVTSSSYWRPSGKDINRGKGVGEEAEWGVRPDQGFEVVVKDEDLQRLVLARHQRDLQQMPAANHKKTGLPQAKPLPEPNAGQPFVDPQLQAAIQYIRKQLAGEQPDH